MKPTVLVEGFLTKQGGVVKSFKKRWCTLNSDGDLCYYKNEGDAKPAGVIKMSEVQEVICAERCSCTWPALSDSTLAFGIVTPKRTWHLICDSKAEFKPWMEAIKRTARIAAAIPIGAPVTGGTEVSVEVSISESGRTRSIARVVKTGSEGAGNKSPAAKTTESAAPATNVAPEKPAAEATPDSSAAASEAPKAQAPARPAPVAPAANNPFGAAPAVSTTTTSGGASNPAANPFASTPAAPASAAPTEAAAATNVSASSSSSSASSSENVAVPAPAGADAKPDDTTDTSKEPTEQRSKEPTEQSEPAEENKPVPEDKPAETSEATTPAADKPVESTAETIDPAPAAESDSADK